MKIRILGAHNVESKHTRFTCVLIDDVLAMEAGALTSRLSLKAQQKLRAVLLTHRHYDHVKDIPAIGMNFYLLGMTLNIYATKTVVEDLSGCFMDGKFYPNFTERPPEKPALKFNIVEPGREVHIDQYKVLPVMVNHAVPCTGYQITSPGGEKVFYTSDTGTGLENSWRQVSPDLLIIEVTAINKYEDFALQARHLTPSLLKTELESFRAVKGYLPRVVTVHANPLDEKVLEAELDEVAGVLKADIQISREGMRIDL